MSFNDDNVFLFSSSREVPHAFFQGYCFVGIDYIYGDEGREKFSKTTGRNVPAGEDGSYITASSYDNFDGLGRKVLTVGTDHHGYKKVFYYWKNGTWAVSNSLYQLSEELKRMGLSVQPNYGQLAASLVGRSFFTQLASFDSVIAGVRLLPAGFMLHIGETCPPHITPVVRESETQESYADALASGVEIWISRFETLLNSEEIELTSDITGGADSRTLLAIYLGAQKRLGIEGREIKFKCGSTPERMDDIKVAKSLSEKYSFSLNEPVVRRQARTSSESLEMWRDLSLGTYFPIYLPRSAPEWQSVTFNGGGGETHRPFYDKNERLSPIENFVETRAEMISPAWLREEWKYSVLASIEFISRDFPVSSYQQALASHYRHFRHRFHTGRAPQNIVSFTPLGSTVFESASQKMTPEARLDGQLNYDIMASLDPSLLEEPFDVPSKSPGQRVRSNLSFVDISTTSSPGRVYAPAAKEMVVERSKNADLFVQLQDKLLEAEKSLFARDFCGEEIIEAANKASEFAVENRRFRLSIDAIPVSNIITSSIFFE